MFFKENEFVGYMLMQELLKQLGFTSQLAR
jgi:hypothetical protein